MKRALTILLLIIVAAGCGSPFTATEPGTLPFQVVDAQSGATITGLYGASSVAEETALPYLPGGARDVSNTILLGYYSTTAMPSVRRLRLTGGIVELDLDLAPSNTGGFVLIQVPRSAFPTSPIAVRAYAADQPLGITELYP